MADDRLNVAREGAVLIVRFNDPATMNALSVDVASALRDRLRDLPGGVRVVVLTGTDRAFCSGANLSGLGGLPPGELDAGLALEEPINPLMLALRDIRVPLVTAVNGAAAGVGASIALMGDIIVAGRSAYFLQAFCRIGLIPDGGSPWLLARAIGRTRAMELMLLGEKLPAVKAFDWGMVTRLVEDDEVVPAALALATRLADGPAFALGLIRRAAWSAAESGFGAQLNLERRLQRDAGFHPDFAEGVSAFHEKRPARFNPPLSD